MGLRLSFAFRTILVKLVSTALTGFFYTARRPRLSEKLAFRKYDPMGESLFLHLLLV